jgi:hypothetical protein
VTALFYATKHYELEQRETECRRRLNTDPVAAGEERTPLVESEGAEGGGLGGNPSSSSG